MRPINKRARIAWTFEDWKGGIKPPKGHDCADCEADGWTGQQVEEYMRATARAFTLEREGGQ